MRVTRGKDRGVVTRRLTRSLIFKAEDFLCLRRIVYLAYVYYSDRVFLRSVYGVGPL